MSEVVLQEDLQQTSEEIYERIRGLERAIERLRQRVESLESKVWGYTKSP